MGVFDGRLVGAGVGSGGIARVDVRGSIVIEGLVEGAVTADDVVAVADGAPLSLRVFDGTERSLTPSYQVDVDREQAKKLGVLVSDVYTTLSTFLAAAM